MVVDVKYREMIGDWRLEIFDLSNGISYLPACRQAGTEQGISNVEVSSSQECFFVSNLLRQCSLKSALRIYEALEEI